MASMTRDAWTDERLDDLNGKVGRLDQRMENGFEGMRTEFQAVRSEMKQESLATRSEIAAQTRSIQQLTFGLFGVMLVGFLGTIATILAHG
jgi:hypothetical protein